MELNTELAYLNLARKIEKTFNIMDDAIERPLSNKMKSKIAVEICKEYLSSDKN